VTTSTRVAAIQSRFAVDGLTGVFVEVLGWESPADRVPPVEANGQHFAPELIAGLKGFRVYAVSCPERPTRQTMRGVDGALAEFSPERLEVFQSPDAWFWHWPRRTSAGTTTFEAVETAPDTLPTFLAQRLTGLEFTLEELRHGVTLVDVRDRVHGNFDASNVTKKFYDRFADEQTRLAGAIDGVPSDEKYNYSTTLLNRLMFLYFMQKKEFLNGDSRYLENTLASVQALRGKDTFYSFYRDALLPLFFHKLNERDGEVVDPAISRILGDVPYVNGGIFGRTDLETTYADEMQVPDVAFERVLAFFAEFNWHLDTRPTGNANEINPEVIGYIFEQFINVASSGKKENGAYYTPHDVTAYMVSQTLVPRVLDDFGRLDIALELLRQDPDRYMQPAMLHGWDQEGADWFRVPNDLVEAWEGDPAEWLTLDQATEDESVNLPAETWVETFHRRDRVNGLRLRIVNGEIASVNDLVTENLNAQLLLTDAIDRLDDAEGIATVFEQLTNLSVFDPTCGSGAFLFAALEVLEDLYDHIIDGARSAGPHPAVEGIQTLVDAQPSKRYFIRKHIAIRNLYGTDLMPGAIETAKLRIFLALAACVDTREELKPLPDLDFNLKVGNLVVGFKDAADAQRLGNDFVAEAYLGDLAPRIDEYARLYREFVEGVETASPGLEDLKVALRRSEQELRADCHQVYADLSGIGPDDFSNWVEQARPLHWFCDFPEILRRGGFDVVVGNPPYVKRSEVRGYEVVGYRTASCADLYAPCYERSLSLTHARGRHAFVVMASLTVWDAFAPLRTVIASRAGAEWWSTFGKIPGALFRGVRVRNTIVVLGPGAEVKTTRHHIHTARQRGWLFPTIEYASSSRQGADWPVRAGVAAPILERLRDIRRTQSPPGLDVAYLRPTASYWFPVLLGPAPVLNTDGSVYQAVDAGLRTIPLDQSEAISSVIAILGGKLAYLWWASIGDDFHVNIREAEALRALAQAAELELDWQPAVVDLLEAAREFAYISLNKQWYVNVRWNNVRSASDRTDRAALAALGGTDQDWRAINVLYRQVMRSSGDSAKGRYVTSDELSQVLHW
jgi:hypothetical protein